MTEAYESLDSLRSMLTRQREDLKEKMARGLEDPTYRTNVGRCKALAETIEKITEQIRSLNGGEDDETSAPGQ